MNGRTQSEGREHRVAALLADLPLVTTRGRGVLEISTVVDDSRFVEPGALFLALTHDERKRARHLEEARQRGARVIVLDRVLPQESFDGLYCCMGDLRSSAASIAHRYYGDPTQRLRVIGVTGTNGKTTVSTLLAAILREHGRSTGLQGTLGQLRDGAPARAGLTTPSCLQSATFAREVLDHGGQDLVLEASSHGLDQGRLEGMAFDVASFSNLTQDHLDYHCDFERYFQAKCLLFEHLLTSSPKATKYAVLNLDDPWGYRLWECLTEQPRGLNTVGYSLVNHPAAAYQGTAHGYYPCLVELRHPRGQLELSSQLSGAFNIENILHAATLALVLGVPAECITSALAKHAPVTGRMELMPSPLGTRIYIDYAHTPGGLERALSGLETITPGRRMVLFGCGGDRDRGKRPAMGTVAAGLADLILLTSDNPRSEVPASILKDIVSGLPTGLPNLGPEDLGDHARGYCVIQDRAEAIAKAVAALRAGDTLIIAGKGHEQEQIFADRRTPFSDHEQVTRAYRTLGEVAR